MEYICKVYKFNKNFNFYFNYFYSIIIILLKWKFFILKFPFIYFLKTQELKNNYMLKFLNKNYYKIFLKNLFNFYNLFYIFYYFNLKLKGLGYRVFVISKNLIKIFLNRSNFFYLHIPDSIILKYRIRHFFFLGLNLNKLKLVVLNLLFLKEFIIYRVAGILITRQIILIKPGKNKFR